MQASIPSSLRLQTEDMPLIEKHWKKERIKYDCIYTGYLGSGKQKRPLKGEIQQRRQIDADRLRDISVVAGKNGRTVGKLHDTSFKTRETLRLILPPHKTELLYHKKRFL